MSCPQRQHFRWSVGTGSASCALAAFIIFGLVRPASNAAQVNPHRKPGVQTSPIQIPEPMRAEHGEIHNELVRATQAPGGVGTAARALAAVLHPHFEREEQIALPPLGLLAPLARGEFKPEMRKVLPLTDSLRAELPRMLEEHKAIHAATVRLSEAARAAGNATVARFTEALVLHARSEEELFYPAALLVGDVVRMRLGQ